MSENEKAPDTETLAQREDTTVQQRPPSGAEVMAYAEGLFALTTSVERYRRELLDPDGVLGKIGDKLDKLASEIGQLKSVVTSQRLDLDILARGHRTMNPRDITVLVVDDHPLVLTSVRRALEHCGMSVVTASSGAEALEALKAGGVHVLLCDLNMPGNGSTTVEHALEHHPDVEVIVFSGGDEESARELLDLGVFAFIGKPFGSEQIKLVVTRAAEHRALKLSNR